MTITEIETLSEPEVKNIAEEEMSFKGHNIYFVTIDGAFGYSAIVFKNEHQIKYANDYALHHYKKDKEDDEAYKRRLNKQYKSRYRKTLFTEKDFTKPLKSYDDYRRKQDYLINWYSLQVDHVSMFGIFNTDEQIKEHNKKIKGLHRDPVGFCYVKDPEFVKKHVELMNTLTKLRTQMEKDYDYLKTAFKYEMYNHEYSINWQADWDVLSVFGNIEYKDTDDLSWYFDQLKFDDNQRRAYLDARKEYYSEIRKKGYY
jgi:hypothetical protein